MTSSSDSVSMTSCVMIFIAATVRVKVIISYTVPQLFIVNLPSIYRNIYYISYIYSSYDVLAYAIANHGRYHSPVAKMQIYFYFVASHKFDVQ